MFAAAQDVNVDPDSEVSQELDTVISSLEPIVRAALEGKATAQATMGALRREGGGGLIEAINWFRKAADQGHALAQYSLGDMYRKGEGIPQDYKEALKWFHKAADQD
jgi:TPR repeat protein